MAILSITRGASNYQGLVDQGTISGLELDACWQAAHHESRHIEDVLLARHALQPAQIGEALSSYFGVPYTAFKPDRVRSEALHGLLKRDFLEAQGWIPLELSARGLGVMCLDPEAVRGLRMVQQAFTRIPQFSYLVSTQLEFSLTLKQLYGVSAMAGSIDALLADLDDSPADENKALLIESTASDNELVKFVNKVIMDAHAQKASDIHIEPMPGKIKTNIRLRIDGTLHAYIEVPAHFRQALVTRIKIMSDLDISERRKPQDGKIQFKKYSPLDIELRVATIPSTGGVEDVVIRILPAGEPTPLNQLGLTPSNQARIIQTIEKPHGLFYVCGPTGSGKTTTLHSILKHLNTEDTKIWTVEDPVEITQKGLRQVQINRKAGIDFALVMRAFLRADPDIIMVGESRDKETVSMGVEASLTGHLVFSTLHTNSAPESITRLLDMGMDPFNFADALLGILAQRLVKKLCGCKQSYAPDTDETRLFVAEYAEELKHTSTWQEDPAQASDELLRQWQQRYGQHGRLHFFRAVGCDVCKQTGYQGRLGLHELLIASDAIKKRIQQRARVAEILALAVAEGMRTLKMDGMEKVLMGLTDLAMVRRVCLK